MMRCYFSKVGVGSILTSRSTATSHSPLHFMVRLPVREQPVSRRTRIYFTGLPAHLAVGRTRFACWVSRTSPPKCLTLPRCIPPLRCEV